MSTSCADDRLALGDLPRVSVAADDHRLVQRGGEQRRQVFRARARAARIARLTLLEPRVQRRPATADLVLALELTHRVTAITPC